MHVEGAPVEAQDAVRVGALEARVLRERARGGRAVGADDEFALAAVGRAAERSARPARHAPAVAVVVVAAARAASEDLRARAHGGAEALVNAAHVPLRRAVEAYPPVVVRALFARAVVEEGGDGAV